MKKLFVILFCVAAGSVYSQTARAKDIKDAPQIKARIANNGHTTKPDVKVSQYHGFDSQISALMIGNIIPRDCPTAIGSSDRKEYLAQLNKWIQQNQNKVAADKKNILITE